MPPECMGANDERPGFSTAPKCLLRRKPGMNSDSNVMDIFLFASLLVALLIWFFAPALKRRFQSRPTVLEKSAKGEAHDETQPFTRPDESQGPDTQRLDNPSDGPDTEISGPDTIRDTQAPELSEEEAQVLLARLQASALEEARRETQAAQAQKEAARLRSEEQARTDQAALVARELALEQAKQAAERKAAQAQRLAREEAARQQTEQERLAAEQAARRQALAEQERQLAALEEIRRAAARERERAERQAAEEQLAALEEAQTRALEAAQQQALEKAAHERQTTERRASARAAQALADAQAEQAAQARRQAEEAAAREAAQELAQRTASELAEELARQPAPAAPKPNRPPEQIVVMVADDSKVVRVKASRLLAKHLYQVVLAEDGADAAEQMKARMPDILITDVEMPGMDGFELTRHIRSNPLTAHIPVIMITAANDRHREAAEEVGVDMLLGKPYEDDDLIARIERSLNLVG